MFLNPHNQGRGSDDGISGIGSGYVYVGGFGMGNRYIEVMRSGASLFRITFKGFGIGQRRTEVYTSKADLLKRVNEVFGQPGREVFEDCLQWDARRQGAAGSAKRA